MDEIGLKPDDTFTCEICGKVEPVGRSEAESIAERERLYPHAEEHPDDGEWLMVCEECFIKNHPERN